jgi:uncharacterized protein HemY
MNRRYYRDMWLLEQLFIVLLVVVAIGLFLSLFIAVPEAISNFFWRRKAKAAQTAWPNDKELARLQKAARDNYTERLRATRITAAPRQ